MAGRPEEPDDPEREADDLTRYFRALPAAERRAYEALAELDRAFGEDVDAEHRARSSS